MKKKTLGQAMLRAGEKLLKARRKRADCCPACEGVGLHKVTCAVCRKCHGSGRLLLT